MTDAQYGMLTGYAYYLLFSVSMTAQGYCIDKYSLNRVYVVGFGGLLGAAALLIQVSWEDSGEQEQEVHFVVSLCFWRLVELKGVPMRRASL